jgi:hypothetical protein
MKITPEDRANGIDLCERCGFIEVLPAEPHPANCAELLGPKPPRATIHNVLHYNGSYTYKVTPLVTHDSKLRGCACTWASPNTCPTRCKLKWTKKCYAVAGMNTRRVWVSCDMELADAFKAIRDLPRSRPVRLHVAGDFPTFSASDESRGCAHGRLRDVKVIDRWNEMLDGRPAWTYTHIDLDGHIENYKAVNASNMSQYGMVVNASTDTLGEALALKRRHPALPVVTIVPHDFPRGSIMTQDREVYACPGGRCIDCMICADPSPRRPIVAFPAHGPRNSAALNQLS